MGMFIIIYKTFSLMYHFSIKKFTISSTDLPVLGQGFTTGVMYKAKRGEGANS
jgi:hypothetical protein